MNEAEVRSWLSENVWVKGQITIDAKTLEVTVDGDCRIKSAPAGRGVRFAHVTGDFDCVDAGQTFLENPPRHVGGVFCCDGAPEHYLPLMRLFRDCDFRALRAWGNEPLEREVNNYMNTQPPPVCGDNQPRRKWALDLQQRLIDADVAPCAQGLP